MAQIQTDIQDARQKDIDREIYDGRIISAIDAKGVGLVDHVGFWRDMKKLIQDDLKKQHANQIVIAGIGQYFHSNESNVLLSSFNKIAVVEINGQIQPGRPADGVLWKCFNWFRSFCFDFFST